MESLRAGISEGAKRASSAPIIAPCQRSFQPLRETLPPEMAFADGWWFSAQKLRTHAAAKIADGQPTTLILLAPSPRKHRVEFTQGGWWEQRGGLYGPSDRTGARFQPWRYQNRISAETQRLFGEISIERVFS